MLLQQVQVSLRMAFLFVFAKYGQILALMLLQKGSFFYQSSNNNSQFVLNFFLPYHFLQQQGPLSTLMINLGITMLFLCIVYIFLLWQPKSAERKQGLIQSIAMLLYFLKYYGFLVIFGTLLQNSYFLLTRLETIKEVLLLLFNLLLMLVGVGLHYLLQVVFFNFGLSSRDQLSQYQHQNEVYRFIFLYLVILLSIFE